MPHQAPLDADLTVNFDNTMTIAEMQSVLDALPKNLNGKTLTIQFANGTYTWDGRLDIQDFVGGPIVVQGDTTETDATNRHTTQNVVLDGTGQGVAGAMIFIVRCLHVQVRNIRFDIDSSVDSYPVHFWESIGLFEFNYVLGTATTTSRGLLVDIGSTVRARNCLFSNVDWAMYANDGGILTSWTNDDTGTSPAYGLFAAGGIIMKRSTPQPTGSTADEGTSHGGVIR